MAGRGRPQNYGGSGCARLRLRQGQDRPRRFVPRYLAPCSGCQFPLMSLPLSIPQSILQSRSRSQSPVPSPQSQSPVPVPVAAAPLVLAHRRRAGLARRPSDRVLPRPADGPYAYRRNFGAVTGAGLRGNRRHGWRCLAYRDVLAATPQTRTRHGRAVDRSAARLFAENQPQRG